MIVHLTMRLCSFLTGYEDILHVGHAEKYHLSRRMLHHPMVVEWKVVPTRVHNDHPLCLSLLTTIWNLSPPLFPSDPLSFFHTPLSSPFPRFPALSCLYGATDPTTPVSPLPVADSAERSETIKSTAESTLPCKLAHCQAQRFTVTCIAYIYL